MQSFTPDHCQHPQLLFSTWTAVAEHLNLAFTSHFCAHTPLFPPTLSFSTKTRTSLSLSATEICVECQRSRAHRLYVFALIVNVAHFSKQFHLLCHFMPRSVDVWSVIISRLHLSDNCSRAITILTNVSAFLFFFFVCVSFVCEIRGGSTDSFPVLWQHSAIIWKWM